MEMCNQEKQRTRHLHSDVYMVTTEQGEPLRAQTLVAHPVFPASTELKRMDDGEEGCALCAPVWVPIGRGLQNWGPMEHR